MAKKKYTFIDLFAGAGGLSEGFLQTGRFEALAHVEWELPMVETLRNRLVKKWGHTEAEAKEQVVLFDIQKTQELLLGDWTDETIKSYGKNNSDLVQKEGLRGVVKKDVDLIIGGPPCQAYSIAGRAQDPNSMKDDYRNFLFESFVKVVDYFKPKLFVFENVPGLLSACPGDKPVRERIYEAFQAIGYSIRKPEDLKDSVYCSEDFDVPQKRNRIIIIGVRDDANLDLEEFYQSLTSRRNTENRKTVKDAIGCMPALYPKGKPEKVGRANVSHEQIGGELIDRHIPRYHSPRDLVLFKEWLDNGMNEFSQKEKLEFYTKITGCISNHVKYRNLEWDKPSPTIVAHLHKDGYMFIHPDSKQLRTITMREAALLQSFPTDYEFCGSNAYCFKMIGNAVPVLFAKGIAEAIYDVLKYR